MWMTDMQIYLSYSRAKDPMRQISVLCQLNGCDRIQIIDAITRCETKIKETDQSYSIMFNRCEKLKGGGSLSMNKRNSEPTSGIKQKKDSDKHTKWKKKTTLLHEYDKDWNNWIDSMRAHLAMAKECESQLIRLERLYYSKKKGNTKESSDD